MKKIIAFLFGTLLASAAFADSWVVRVEWYSYQEGTMTQYYAIPQDNSNCIMAMRYGSTPAINADMGCITFGTGVSLSTNRILSFSPTQSQITGALGYTPMAVPTGTTSQYVRGDGSLATFPTTTTRSFAYPVRSLNTCYQISATRDTLVSYSVDIGTTSTLLNGQVGTIYLRTYSNSSCTTGAQEVARFVNGNTQTLGVSVTMLQNVTGTLTGVIPAGAYVQQVTENTTGTPTFTFRSSQEVQL
jgi:hypothetical protein